MIGNTNAGQTIPSVNNPTITFTQGGVSKGDITLNQSSNETIALDGNGFSKLTGTIATSDWQGGSGGGCWLDGTDLLTWTEETLYNGTKIGLVAGETYTFTFSLNNEQFTATGVAEDLSSTIGLPNIVGFSRFEYMNQAQTAGGIFTIYDGICLSGGSPLVGDYSIVTYTFDNYGGETNSLSIVSLTGAGIGGGGGYTATISNNEIKVNSSVDMFVNTALNFTAEKSEGAITLTSSTQPSESLNYVLECIDTPSESALSVFNLYKPSSISETDAKSLIGQNMFFTNDSTSPATVYGGTWTELGTMSVGSSTIHCWKRS